MSRSYRKSTSLPIRIDHGCERELQFRFYWNMLDNARQWKVQVPEDLDRGNQKVYRPSGGLEKKKALKRAMRHSIRMPYYTPEERQALRRQARRQANRRDFLDYYGD